MLRRYRVSALPVVDGAGWGLIAGYLTMRPAVTATPADPVEQAARMMSFMRVKRLPVVNSGGQLVGIISRADVLAVFDRTDEDIRTDIVDGILRHELSSPVCAVCDAAADGLARLPAG